jgi:hypothetical protein
MTDVSKLDEVSHRMTIGIDLLSEMVFELGNSKEVDDTLQSRAWFVAQALKREAAELWSVAEKIVGDDAKARYEEVNGTA